MKKKTAAILAVCMVSSLLCAASISKTAMTVGYGWARDGERQQHGIDLGVYYGYAQLNERGSIGIGMGMKSDVYFSLAGYHDDYFSVLSIMGPQFVSILNPYVTVNTTVGPAFEMATFGPSESEVFALGAGIDLNVSLVPPGFRSISFTFGASCYNTFSLSDASYRLNVMPYIAFSGQFFNVFHEEYHMYF